MTLDEQIKAAGAYVDALSPEAYAEMVRAQAKSWMKAEAMWPKPKFQWVNGVKVYESYADYCA